MDGTDDFFGSQDGQGDRHIDRRELDIVQQRFRDMGYREAADEARQTALQVGFEEGFESGVRESDRAGFWLGVASATLMLAESGGIQLGEAEREQLSACRDELIHFIEDGASRDKADGPDTPQRLASTRCAELCRAAGVDASAKADQ